MMRDIKDIFFDLDGTLWDFKENSRKAFYSVFQEYEVPVSMAEFFEAYTPINQYYWDQYRRQLITHEDLNARRFQETFSRLKIERSKDWLNQFRHAYLEGLSNTETLFPRTLETLNYLKKRYSLHIITDGFSQIQKGKLKRSGIYSYFQTMTFSDEAGVTKPHPGIFEMALNRAGAQTKQSLMVGDHLEFDIKGAKDFGLKTIHFAPDQTQGPQQTERISSILELTKIL